MNFARIINYIVMYFTIMASGNPAVRVLVGDNNAVIIIFVVAFLLAVSRPIRFSKDRLVFLVGIVLILMVHIMVFGPMVSNASIGFLLLVLTGALLASAMNRFLVYFVNCMAFISLCSIPLYFLMVLPETPIVDFSARLAIWDGPYHWSLERYLVDSSIWVQTLRERVFRNCGPFWEPGAFAGYLVLALLSIVLTSDKIKYNRFSVFLIFFALLTTMSTAGYLAAFVVIGIKIYKKFSGNNKLVTLIVLPVMLGGFAYMGSLAAERIPFINEKIQDQLLATEEEKGSFEKNRFGNMQYDFMFIAARPIFGWSANVETRLQLDPFAEELTAAQGNALTGSMVRFGVLGWMLIMGTFVLSFSKIAESRFVGFLGMLVVAALLVGEKLLNYPFIMGLLFMSTRHLRYSEIKVRKTSKMRLLRKMKKQWQTVWQFGKRRVEQ